MLGWVSQQLKDHGVVVTTRLLGRVVMSPVRVEFGNKLLPVKVVCPCCGWRGRQFHDYIEVGYTGRNSVCPQCESHPMHRYLSLWLAREFELEEKSGVALIFAAREGLRARLAEGDASEGLWDRYKRVARHTDSRGH